MPCSTFVRHWSIKVLRVILTTFRQSPADNSRALIFHLLCLVVTTIEKTDGPSNRRMHEYKKQSENIHFKTYLLVVFVVIFGPLGNVLVGKGAKSVGALNSWQPAAVLYFFWHAFTSSTIWLGIAS